MKINIIVLFSSNENIYVYCTSTFLSLLNGFLELWSEEKNNPWGYTERRYHEYELPANEDR